MNMRLGRMVKLEDDGRPFLYTRFLANMLAKNLENTVFPYPQTSILAARTLAYFRWNIDIVYVDSAHEMGETFIEMFLYYQLLRPGGLLIGDDYGKFKAVAHDVDAFAKYVGSEVYFIPNTVAGQWLLQKKYT